MIEGLRPYPEIAATEVGWLPQLPPHWQVMRAKYVFREVDCRSVDGAETHLSMHQKLGLVPSASTGEKRLVSESYAGGKVVEPNDLVLNRLKAHLGVFAHANQKGVISPDYTVLRPLPNAVIRYYEYLLKSPACRGELRTRIKGIVEGFWRLYTDDFYDIRLPVPPLDEQRLIVRFLDWHGAITGKLIRAKRRLIALLNEQKQSIVHRAVTHGVNPAAKLKPSGVDRLGDVPEHWGVKRLKFACQVNARTSAPSPDVQVTFLPMENVSTTGQVDYSVQRSTADVSTGYTSFQQGDVILAKITPCFENGKGALLSDMPTTVGYGSTEFIVLRPMQGLLAEYAYLLTVDPVFRLRGTEAMTGSAGQQRVSPDFVANWVIGLPPEAEQRAICAHVRDHTAEFDAAIGKVQSEIKFIQEFRARLIADVVTGQLDVRDMAASLPEVAEADMAGDLTDDDDLVDDADDLIDEEEAA